MRAAQAKQIAVVRVMLMVAERARRAAEQVMQMVAAQVMRTVAETAMTLATASWMAQTAACSMIRRCQSERSWRHPPLHMYSFLPHSLPGMSKGLWCWGCSLGVHLQRWQRSPMHSNCRMHPAQCSAHTGSPRTRT